MILNKKIQIAVIINSILLICIGIAILIQYCNTDKIGYIENIKVFDGFNMAREIKAKGELELNSRKKTIDGLNLELNDQSKKGDKNIILQKLMQEKENLENFNQKFTAGETEKIWSRINEYAKDFSEKNGYDLVFGSQQNVNILYAKEDKNITSEFLNYINTRYEGN